MASITGYGYVQIIHGWGEFKRSSVNGIIRVAYSFWKAKIQAFGSIPESITRGYAWGKLRLKTSAPHPVQVSIPVGLIHIPGMCYFDAASAVLKCSASRDTAVLVSDPRSAWSRKSVPHKSHERAIARQTPSFFGIVGTPPLRDANEKYIERHSPDRDHSTCLQRLESGCRVEFAHSAQGTLSASLHTSVDHAESTVWGEGGRRMGG